MQGHPCITKAGELSLAPGMIKLLSPTLHMLPTPHYGLKDQEQRYRMRYLDLIMNRKVRDIFLTRTSVIRQLRDYFDAKGFLEVETPSLNVI